LQSTYHIQASMASKEYYAVISINYMDSSPIEILLPNPL
jgi:hypothetical protein